MQQSVQYTVSKFRLTHLMLHFLQEGLEQLCLLGQGCLLAWWRGVQFYFQCCRQLWEYISRHRVTECAHVRACVFVSSTKSVNINILYDNLVSALTRCMVLNIPETLCV